MQWLIIGVLVLWGVLWVVWQIFQAIGEFIDGINKTIESKKQERIKKIQADEALKQKQVIAQREKAEAEAKEQWQHSKRQLESKIHFELPEVDLDRIEEKLIDLRADIQRKSKESFRTTTPYWNDRVFSHFKPEGTKRDAKGTFYVSDIAKILSPNFYTWSRIENQYINQNCEFDSTFTPASASSFRKLPHFTEDIPIAKFEFEDSINENELKEYFSDEQRWVQIYNHKRDALLKSISEVNEFITQYNSEKEQAFEVHKLEQEEINKETKAKFDNAKQKYLAACEGEVNSFKALKSGYEDATKNAVIARLDKVISTIKLPSTIPHTWDIDFDENEKIAIVEVKLPDVVHDTPLKQVRLKSGLVDKPLNQTEKKEIIPTIHPAIILRYAYEIFREDFSNTLKLLVVNGWIEFDDPATGVKTKSYTASLMVEKNQVEQMNLEKIEPLTAFNNLKGKSAGKLIEIVPITPVMSLDKKDSRFIKTSEVLNALGSETNLASMDWKDFESLIAELFEKEFAQVGAEVKVTQASRDRGVDAVIFDPDPIRGGKIIVQAKRYANTVDVSAVRDLCAVVKKEGAIKGILVTTSTYGGDAYKFANNEPVTLLNGGELLGLLKKHGYSFRINLQEAKKLLQANQ